MSKFFSRKLIIFNAYLFAVIGAYAVIAASLIIRVALNDPDESIGYVLSVSFLLAILGAGIPPLSVLLLPALAVILAERSSIRSWVYYVGAGAVTGIFVHFTTVSEKATDAHGGHVGIVAALSLLAGLTGGLIYWRMAGRDTGAGTNAAERSSEDEGETKK